MHDRLDLFLLENGEYLMRGGQVGGIKRGGAEVNEPHGGRW